MDILSFSNLFLDVSNLAQITVILAKDRKRVDLFVLDILFIFSYQKHYSSTSVPTWSV
jgi:hypothetical protein